MVFDWKALNFGITKYKTNSFHPAVCPCLVVYNSKAEGLRASKIDLILGFRFLGGGDFSELPSMFGDCFEFEARGK